jgi:hypothetical protein
MACSACSTAVQSTLEREARHGLCSTQCAHCTLQYRGLYDIRNHTSSRKLRDHSMSCVLLLLLLLVLSITHLAYKQAYFEYRPCCRAPCRICLKAASQQSLQLLRQPLRKWRCLFCDPHCRAYLQQRVMGPGRCPREHVQQRGGEAPDVHLVGWPVARRKLLRGPAQHPKHNCMLQTLRQQPWTVHDSVSKLRMRAGDHRKTAIPMY